jgi:hypothetical protein
MEWNEKNSFIITFPMLRIPYLIKSTRAPFFLCNIKIARAGKTNRRLDSMTQ